MKKVNWLHVRVGHPYSVRRKGEWRTVWLVEILRNGAPYLVRDAQTREEFLVIGLYHAFQIGGGG